MYQYASMMYTLQVIMYNDLHYIHFIDNSILILLISSTGCDIRGQFSDKLFKNKPIPMLNSSLTKTDRPYHIGYSDEYRLYHQERT